MWLKFRKLVCSIKGHSLFNYTTSKGLHKADCTYCGAENLDV